MTVALVTRPKEESELLALKLNELGIDSLIAPLLNIKLIDNNKEELEQLLTRKIQAIVLTSSNGVRGLANLIEPQIIVYPLIVIGSKTAKTAERLGFKHIVNVEGDGEKLSKYILSNYTPSKGDILYISGDIIAIDLEEILKVNGFNVNRVIVYTSTPASHLPLKVKTVLEKEALSMVLFFSYRTAKTFIDLIEIENLQTKTENIRAFVLSEKIASVTRKLNWKEICIAAKPNEEAILNLIRNCYGR